MPVPITHIITDLSTGGSQRALVHLLRGLDRDRFLPSVVCLAGGAAPMARDIESLDIPVVYLGLDRRRDPGVFRRLHTHLEQHRPLILHSWLFHSAILAL